VRGGDDVVSRINDEIQRASAAGAFVIYTQDWHPPSTPHFAKDGGVWPVHCVAETWGAELHPGLVVAGPSVRKGSNGEDGYSGFTMRDPETGEDRPTALEALLGQCGVMQVVVSGLATDYCVRGTVLDAVRLGFETVVLTDAVAAVELVPGDADRALGEMAAAGALLQ
jgi:nicotinamidase/pyrazinamidase